MVKVGIIGCGFVGGALKAWLEENNKDVQILVSDPPKGYNDDLSGIDVAFLQIHVPTEDDGTQDLTLMKELIRKLPNVPVFVRTTILPGTSDMLSKETGHQVCYMPEFLTERTHIEDFKKQTMVFTGAVDLLIKVFPGKKFTVMSPLEAELTKYIIGTFSGYERPMSPAGKASRSFDAWMSGRTYGDVVREREEMPDRVHSCRYLPMPVFDEFKPGVSHEGEADRQRLPDMAVLYGILVRNYADSFRKILTAIMQHDFSEGAVLWHCTEGKDRCGITTALVLELLGVDRTVILEDYLKTNIVNRPKAAAIRAKVAEERGEEIAESVYRAYLADERYLRSAWEAMGDRFIPEKLGIGEEAIAAFRNTVLE